MSNHVDHHHLERSHPVGHGTNNPDDKNSNLGTIPNVVDAQLNQKGNLQAVDLKTKTMTNPEAHTHQKDELKREGDLENETNK